VAEVGYFAVRYDARGVGQTGGRIESAGLAEYAEDVLAIVQWLRKRPDVDADRIALVGYGEGGPIAMLVASREKRVKALALLASPGRSGREVTLEQQERLLAGLAISDADKTARRALQTRVNEAAVTGRGWEGVPAELRRQADTAWFRSWLAFDPAVALRRVEQPVLIVHGTLDQEVPVVHADRLEELSRTARKRPETHTKKVVVPGVNHLLVAAESGDIDEYVTLQARDVSPSVTSALLTWLPAVWAPR
jgi:pimeloyl-ACP methyl ester carboxylesterase